MSDLSKQVNIGKELERKLTLVGINSVDELKAAGSEKAFLLIKAIDSGACINMLYALEGAVNDTRWHNLPAERKMELKAFFNSTD